MGRPGFFEDIELRLDRNAQVRFVSDYLYDESGQRIGSGVDEKHPPVMDRKVTACICDRTGGIGEQLDSGLMQRFDNALRGS